MNAFKSRLKSEVYLKEEDEKCLQHDLADYLDTLHSMDSEKFTHLVNDDCLQW